MESEAGRSDGAGGSNGMQPGCSVDVPMAK